MRLIRLNAPEAEEEFLYADERTATEWQYLSEGSASIREFVKRRLEVAKWYRQDLWREGHAGKYLVTPQYTSWRREIIACQTALQFLQELRDHS